MSTNPPQSANLLLNNAAGRLLHLINELRKYRATLNPNQNQDQIRCEEAFFTIWGVKKGDRSALLVMLARAFALPEQIRDSVSRYDDLSRELLLKWVPKIEQLFTNLNLAMLFRDFVSQIDDTTVYGIEICSDFLSRKAPEKVLTDAQVKDLNEEVRALIETVVASKLPLEMKQFLLLHLDAVSRALREYRLTGTMPLEQALNAAVGAGITQHDLAKKTFADENGKKVWALFSKIHTVVGATWNLMQIGDKGGQWFGNLLL